MKLRLSQLLLFLAGASCVSVARAQQQFPMMDRVADRVIQKYQQSPCSELKAQRERPKGPQEQRALHNCFATTLRCAALLSTAWLPRLQTRCSNAE